MELNPAPLPSHAPERRRIAGRGTDESTWRASHVATLPDWDTAAWTGGDRRVWVIAPHPDDQVLGVGGSLSMLSGLGARVTIVSVSDGEASPADSSIWTPISLATARRAELFDGLAALGIDADVVRLGLPDGRLDAYRQALLHALLERVGEGDLLLSTCMFDGHPDHESCGEVAAIAAELTGAVLVEYPVWMWHWAVPDEPSIPWERARRLPVDDDLVRRKRAAIGSFATQLQPDGEHEPILPPHVVERFLRGYEVVFA